MSTLNSIHHFGVTWFGSEISSGHFLPLPVVRTATWCHGECLYPREWCIPPSLYEFEYSLNRPLVSRARIPISLTLQGYRISRYYEDTKFRQYVCWTCIRRCRLGDFETKRERVHKLQFLSKSVISSVGLNAVGNCWKQRAKKKLSIKLLSITMIGFSGQWIE